MENFVNLPCWSAHKHQVLTNHRYSSVSEFYTERMSTDFSIFSLLYFMFVCSIEYKIQQCKVIQAGIIINLFFTN